MKTDGRMATCVTFGETKQISKQSSVGLLAGLCSRLSDVVVSVGREMQLIQSGQFSILYHPQMHCYDSLVIGNCWSQPL